MQPDVDDFIPTRRSLLSRLRSRDDQACWQQFFGTHGRLIYHLAVKASLTDAEAQDVVQDTIILVLHENRALSFHLDLLSLES